LWKEQRDKGIKEISKERKKERSGRVR